jgi:hypothetical protein
LGAVSPRMLAATPCSPPISFFGYVTDSSPRHETYWRLFASAKRRATAFSSADPWAANSSAAGDHGGPTARSSPTRTDRDRAICVTAGHPVCGEIASLFPIQQ